MYSSPCPHSHKTICAACPQRLLTWEGTPPIAEIIWVKNLRAIVICGFLMKKKKNYPENLKKIGGALCELPAK